eukprot:scpid81069/ scgid21190/ 
MRLGVVVALLQVIFCTQLLLVEICNGELTDAKYAEHLRNVLESADEYDVEDKTLSHTSDDDMDVSVEDDDDQILSVAAEEDTLAGLSDDHNDHADFGEKTGDSTELRIREDSDQEEDGDQGEASDIDGFWIKPKPGSFRWVPLRTVNAIRVRNLRGKPNPGPVYGGGAHRIGVGNKPGGGRRRRYKYVSRRRRSSRRRWHSTRRRRAWWG